MHYLFEDNSSNFISNNTLITICDNICGNIINYFSSVQSYYRKENVNDFSL